MNGIDIFGSFIDVLDYFEMTYVMCLADIFLSFIQPNYHLFTCAELRGSYKNLLE